MEVKRIKQITLDVLSFKGREVAFVKFIGKLHRSEKVDESDDGRKPATVARVINLEDGQEYRLVCPSLLVSALNEDETEYLNKCYEIRVSLNTKPGKAYKEVEVYEIQCTTEDTKE